jgi:hypothetical protein
MTTSRNPLPATPPTRPTPPRAPSADADWSQSRPSQPLPSLPIAWWYRLSAPPDVPVSASLTAREYVRRGRLAALILLGLVAVVLLALPELQLAPGLRPGIAVVVLGCLAAIPLNRAGYGRTAGVVLVVTVDLALVGTLLTAGSGLDPLDLPAFYLLVTSELIAVSLLPPVSVFLLAFAHSLFIALDVQLQVHTAMWDQMITTPGVLYSLIAGPIALQLIVAVVSFLWVRSAQTALRRADQAEEIAAWEARDRERTFALEEGVRYLQQTLAEWASGDVRSRIPPMPVAILEQVRTDLNAFIERFRPQVQPSFQLYRLQQEAQGLTAALEDWVQGRPVVWPAPSGTPLDRAVALLSQSRSLPPPPTYPSRPTPRLSRPTAPPIGPPPVGLRPSYGPAPTMAEWEQRVGREPMGRATTGQPATGRPTGAPRPIDPDVPDWLWPQSTSQPLPQPADSLDVRASRDPISPLDPLGPLLGQLPPESPPLG